MTALVLIPGQLVVDSNGDVRSGAQMYVYDAGTTTPRAAYTTSALATAHAVPIESVSTGLFPAAYVDPDGGDYKLVIKDANGVTLNTYDDIPAVQPVSADQIWPAINGRTAIETTAGVTPADYSYRPGEVDRYDSPADALLASKGPSYEMLFGAGTYTLTAALAIDEPVVMRGVGTNTGASAGSILDNTTNDVAAITIDGGTQRCKIEDIGFAHEAASRYAIEVLGGAYTQLDNVVVNCNSVGYGGVLFGDDAAETTAELSTAAADSWQGTCNNLRVDNATDYGVRVNSSGHTWEFRNCSFRSTVAGAHGIYISAPNVHIYGGQIGANNTGGTPIYWNNLRGGLLREGSANDLKFENVASGEYAVVIDGATNAFEGIELKRLAANFTNGVTTGGTLVKFGRATYCWLIDPIVETPTGGGILCEWGENSVDCGVICDYNGGRAPVTVHASATRAIKRVKGRLPIANVANITTNANLTVVLQDGVVELPAGFTPVHNGTGWNYAIATVADDAATSITVPIPVGASILRARVTVMTNGGVNFGGEAQVDVDAGGAAISSRGSGADFNVTTGALAGTTGSDVKVTLSAHTDGAIYIENRSGGSLKFTVLFHAVGNL